MCTHASADLFPHGWEGGRAEGGQWSWNDMTAAWCISCKGYRNRAVCTSEKKCWWESSMPGEWRPVWPNLNQTGGKKMDRARTGTGDLIVLPGSVLPLLWRDLCLFMYHYFGHWHVRMLFFSLLYGLSQSLYTGVQCQEGSPGGDRKRGRQGGSGDVGLWVRYANREATFSYIYHTCSVC